MRHSSEKVSFVDFSRGDNITEQSKKNGSGEPPMTLEVRVSKLESDVEYIKRDVSEIKTDIKEMRKDIGGLRNDISELKGSHTHLIRLTYLTLGTIVTGTAGLLFAAMKIAFFP